MSKRGECSSHQLLTILMKLGFSSRPKLSRSISRRKTLLQILMHDRDTKFTKSFNEKFSIGKGDMLSFRHSILPNTCAYYVEALHPVASTRILASTHFRLFRQIPTSIISAWNIKHITTKNAAPRQRQRTPLTAEKTQAIFARAKYDPSG